MGDVDLYVVTSDLVIQLDASVVACLGSCGYLWPGHTYLKIFLFALYPLELV